MKALAFVCTVARRARYAVCYSDRLPRWLFCAACIKYLIGGSV